jgi:polysaccharide export outer membrane protein
LIQDGRKPPEVRFEPIPEADRELLLGEPQLAVYRIGIGDILQVTGDVPFLEGLGETTKGDLTGIHVKPDGNIYLPEVGAVPAAGRTVIEVQDDLRERLTRFRTNPFVSVDVLEPRSQHFYVLGEVAKPGVFPVDGQASLLAAVAAAGGPTQKASLETAYVLRQGRVLPLNLADVVVRGDLTRNVRMRDQDIVVLPSYEEQRVYVVGEVGAPGVVPMEKGELTLAGAIAVVGGLDATRADFNSVRVFRGDWSRPSCYTISACDLYAYGEGIRLQDGDRVIVAPSREATYKAMVDLTMPYVLAVTSTALSAATLGISLSN